MNNPEAPTEEVLSPHALLHGGEHVEVTTIDGKSSKVLVQQIPVRMWDQALGVAFVEPQLLELVCGKDPGWHATLTPRSYGHVRAACERQNRDFFESAEGRVRMMAKIPGFMDTLLGKATASRVGSSGLSF